MNRTAACLAAFGLLLGSTLGAQQVANDSANTHRPPHSIRLIAVDKLVRLEVLDWGGSRRPVVFLAGLGNTAHIFDQFAPKLTREYRVYAITRRGFGASRTATSDFAADRLGDDVLAVLDSLGLQRPVLVGHSIAGSELSSVASRHPERLAGVVYLEAAYAYAYFDREHGDLSVDVASLRRKLDKFFVTATMGPSATKALIDDLLTNDLPLFQKELRAAQRMFAGAPAAPPVAAPPAFLRLASEVLAGPQKYTSIPVPALAIYALPRRQSPTNDAVAQATARLLDSTTALQAAAFEKGVSSARVVRVPNASHYIFTSHEAMVLQEIRALVAALPTSREAQSVESFDLADVGTSVRWKVFGRTTAIAERKGKRALTLSERTGNGVVWLDGYTFVNGSIDVDVLGRTQPHQTSFIAVAFRVLDGTTHDAVYVRPFNFRARDSVAHAHAVQYVSHPDWPWQRLRSERPGEYEKAVVPEPDGDEWVHLRIVVERPRVSVYVNGAREPSLVVDELSSHSGGSVGLWVGNGSGGSFANLRISRKSR